MTSAIVWDLFRERCSLFKADGKGEVLQLCKYLDRYPSGEKLTIQDATSVSYKIHDIEIVSLFFETYVVSEAPS